MDTIDAGGIALPKLGLGTYRMQGDICRAAVESALGLGYRHVDTAEMYGNEDAVGAAIAAIGLPRTALYVTTKVWWQNLAPDAIRRAMAASLERLRLDHSDLYLVHWPSPDIDVPRVIETLLRLRDEGRARAIGVCNFPSALWRQAVAAAGPGVLACNQVEYHVLLGQDVVVPAVRDAGAAVVAYAPLAQGRLAAYPALDAIAARHGATAAQVALAWLLEQDGVAAIPKAAGPTSQAANLGALAIRLGDADRAAIAALPKDERFVKPGFAPAWDN